MQTEKEVLADLYQSILYNKKNPEKSLLWMETLNFFEDEIYPRLGVESDINYDTLRVKLLQNVGRDPLFKAALELLEKVLDVEE